MPGRWSHLAARFFDVVTSRPLDPAEESLIRSWLKDPAEQDAFFGQSVPDQRHGFASARYVISVAPDRPELVRAAMLHDIGKRHSHVGAVSRILASVAIRLGFPLPQRWKMYRDHGALGAAELAGAETVVVEFARHHHGSRPPTISPDDWELLLESDRARVGR